VEKQEAGGLSPLRLSKLDLLIACLYFAKMLHLYFNFLVEIISGVGV